MSRNSFFILVTCLGRPTIIHLAVPGWAFLASIFPVWGSWPHDKPPICRARICLGLSPLDGLPSPPIFPCPSNSIFCHPRDWHNAWQAMIPRKSLTPFNRRINALRAKKIRWNGGYTIGIKRSVSVFCIWMKVSIHLWCDPLVHLFKPAADGRLTVTSYKKFSAQLRTVSEVLLTRNQPQPDLTALTDSY
jgi:hypothetical protein